MTGETPESVPRTADADGAGATALMHQVGSRAVHWLEEHRDGFRTPDRAAAPDQVKEFFKPVGELALMGRVLTREGVAGTSQAAQMRRLLDFAWRDVLDGGGLLAWMQRDEPLSPVPLEVYTAFRELGYHHPEVERHARVMSGIRSWQALEMLPNRRLGLTRHEARAELTSGAETAAALRSTWLAQTPEPWTVDYHIAYVVTHTVFHLTDWGARLDALPGDIAGYLTRWLPVWVDEWREKEHWDLLGELLVVDAMLPRPAWDAAAWQSFAQAQGADGAMPLERTRPADGADEFGTLYHPTLVAVFASTMATSRALTALTGSAS
ncbi:DUF6895 family protein [Streptomyces sp. NPDC050161]|uniref:DUF6895 family protein n=1 Tax=Streptomyces sp. NPDC050161 TaxID=3365604 RepID=UPI0037BCA237